MNIIEIEMEDCVNIFKAFSDKTRLEIMWLLCKAKSGLCVCEIMDALNASQYNVSRHLKVLKAAGLVRDRKEGRWVFYDLASPINRFHELILQAVSALQEEQLSLKHERLKKRLSLRKDGECVIGVNSREWRNIVNQLTIDTKMN